MDTKLKIIVELEKKSLGIHLREISRLVGSGLPNIKRFLDILEKEKVVKKNKEANLVKYTLRESERTIAYLKLIHTEKFLLLPNKIQTAVNDFLEEIEIKPLIALIFGSYSKGNYTKESDIDILLIFQRLENDKEIENTAKKINMRTNAKLSPIYLSYNVFKKNFLDKDHDFLRGIRQSVVIINGVEIYYKLFWRFLR